MLGIKPDKFTHTSDHFDRIQELCEWMLREGKAYADDTDPEQMKKEREERVESANRTNCEYPSIQVPFTKVQIGSFLCSLV